MQVLQKAVFLEIEIMKQPNVNSTSTHYPLAAPTTIVGMIQLRMYERKLTQVSISEMFGMSTAKVSQIMNGKRQMDVAFLKAVHEKLEVDGNFILMAV